MLWIITFIGFISAFIAIIILLLENIQLKQQKEALEKMIEEYF
jgi:hypothetical protein